MRIGTVKEIKNHEYRVGLTPGAVREYAAHGHTVIVETGAGAGIGADDAAYKAAGAAIVGTAQAMMKLARTTPRPMNSRLRSRAIAIPTTNCKSTVPALI